MRYEWIQSIVTVIENPALKYPESKRVQMLLWTPQQPLQSLACWLNLSCVWWQVALCSVCRMDHDVAQRAIEELLGSDAMRQAGQSILTKGAMHNWQLLC